MIDFTKFQELLLALEKASKLNAVGPKPSSTFNDAVSNLIGFPSFFPAAYSPTMITKDLIQGFTKAQYDSLTYGNSFEMFDHLVDAFVVKLKDTNKTISEIKEQVTLLTKDINARIETHLANNPFSSVHYGKTESDVEYDIMDWSDYTVLGSDQQIIEDLHNLINVKDTTTTSLNNISLAVRKLVETSFDFKTIDLPKEVVDGVITQINTEIPEILIDDVRDCYKILTNKIRAERFRNNVIAASKKPADSKSMVFYVQMFHKLYRIVNMVEGGYLDLSKTASESLINNCKTIHKYLLIMAYILIYDRREFFKEALILPGLQLNSDNLEEFKKQGGTMQSIAHHLNYMYEDGKLPLKGIMMSSVLTLADNIKARVLKETSNIQTRLKLIKNDAIRSASRHVLSTYLKEQRDLERTITNTNPEAFIANVCETVITQDKVLEDVLYQILIGLFYKNDFVEVVYHRLGKEYLELLTNKSDINDTDVLVSEISVFVDLIVDFLCKFVEKK